MNSQSGDSGRITDWRLIATRANHRRIYEVGQASGQSGMRRGTCDPSNRPSCSGDTRRCRSFSVARDRPEACPTRTPSMRVVRSTPWIGLKRNQSASVLAGLCRTKTLQRSSPPWFTSPRSRPSKAGEDAGAPVDVRSLRLTRAPWSRTSSDGMNRRDPYPVLAKSSSGNRCAASATAPRSTRPRCPVRGRSPARGWRGRRGVR